MADLAKIEDKVDKLPHSLRKDKKLCQHCFERPAIFIRRTRYVRSGKKVLTKRLKAKADKDHKLCPQCHRSLMNSYYVRMKYDS